MSWIETLKRLNLFGRKSSLEKEQSAMTDAFMNTAKAFEQGELKKLLDESFSEIAALSSISVPDESSENRRKFWQVIFLWLSAKMQFLSGDYARGYAMAEKALEKSYEIRRSKPEMFEIPLYALMGASLMMSHWRSSGACVFSKDDPRLAEFYINRSFDSCSVFKTIFWREKAIAGQVMRDFYRLVKKDEARALEWDNRLAEQEKIGGI